MTTDALLRTAPTLLQRSRHRKATLEQRRTSMEAAMAASRWCGHAPDGKCLRIPRPVSEWHRPSADAVTMLWTGTHRTLVQLIPTVSCAPYPHPDRLYLSGPAYPQFSSCKPGINACLQVLNLNPGPPDDPADEHQRGEGAAGQQPAWLLQSEPPSMSAAGQSGEADTKEAAYARMQALLAERNGLPPPQSSAVPPVFEPLAAGAASHTPTCCGLHSMILLTSLHQTSWCAPRSRAAQSKPSGNQVVHLLDHVGAANHVMLHHCCPGTRTLPQ